MFYAETIGRTPEMQLPFGGCGEGRTAHSSADSGRGQEEEGEHTTWEVKEKVKKDRT